MQKQKQPVTVIIPNYNHARFLPDRLDSVLSQSYQNLQVILMDDCSTDESRVILERYARRDTRIELVYNEQNSGSTFKQWNKGISLASGEYVWIAESDDVAELTFLEKLVNCLDDHPDAGLAYCQSCRIDEDGRRAGIAFVSEDELALDDFYLSGSKLAKNYMAITNIIPNASAALMRKRVSTGRAASAKHEVSWGLDVLDPVYASHERMLCCRNVERFSHSLGIRFVLRPWRRILRICKVQAYIKNVVAPSEDVYKKSLEMLIERWFHVFIYSSLTLRKHCAFVHEMEAIEPAFKRLFTRLVIARLFRDRLSGFKMLVGDKLLGRSAVPVNPLALGRPV